MGFFKKLGRALGKGLKTVEKATRPIHGIARTAAATAANVVAPGSGQLVHAFTGGNRGAAVAGGVGGMLPELGRITGINVEAGKPFQFSLPGKWGPVTPAEMEKGNEWLRQHPATERVLNEAAEMVPGVRQARRVLETAQRSAAGARRMTVGYQGDSPPLMSSHAAGSTGSVRYLPGQAAAPGKRRRRMNPLNLRALRRGVSRARSFERIARRVVNLNVNRKFKRRKRGRR